MQLSIELLPAPLGPMIERISCSRTSKLMLVSAFTPPKARLMSFTSRMTSPRRRPAAGLVSAPAAGAAARTPLSTVATLIRRAARSRRPPHRRQHRHVDDLEIGRQLAAAPVLERHLGRDVLVVLAAVERVEEHAV